MTDSTCVIAAAKARGITIEPSGEAEHPWAAVVWVRRRNLPLVRVLDAIVSPSAAALARTLSNIILFIV